MATRKELTEAVAQRYRAAAKRDKSKILDEFVALTKYHRKHAIRVRRSAPREPHQRPGRNRLYDEAVRQALIVLWEASDRLCGKRLKALVPLLVDAMERHGHIFLDAGLKDKLLRTSDDKLTRARALGADDTVNYRIHPDWEQQVLALTGGRGVDHVVEVGGAGTLEKSCIATRHGGKIWLIGVLTGFEATINPITVLLKSLCVQGIYVGSREMFEAMNAAFSANRVTPVIDRVFPFTDARAAFHCMQEAKHFGKLVVTVD